MEKIQIKTLVKSLIGMEENEVFEDGSGIRILYFKNWGDQVVKLIIPFEMLKDELKDFVEKYEEEFEVVYVDGEKLLGLDVLEGPMGQKLRKELLKINGGESLKGDIGMVLLTPDKKFVEIELIFGGNYSEDEELPPLDEVEVERIIDVITDVVDERFIVF